jgi:hypothetical protein
MPRTIQIRDLDDDVQEWLTRTRRRPSAVTTAEVLEALDEQRGPWPDARG